MGTKDVVYAMISQMVKKNWNLSNLVRNLDEIQDCYYHKNRLIVRIVEPSSNSSVVDFALTSIDLAKHEITQTELNNKKEHIRANNSFHKLRFYFEFYSSKKDGKYSREEQTKIVNEKTKRQIEKTKRQIGIRVLDAESKILADGISSSNEMFLSFYINPSKKSKLITIQFRSYDMAIGDNYSLTRINHEVLSDEEMASTIILPAAQQNTDKENTTPACSKRTLSEPVPAGGMARADEQHTSVNDLSLLENHYVWRYLLPFKQLLNEGCVSTNAAKLHKKLLLLNRGDLICETFYAFHRSVLDSSEFKLAALDSNSEKKLESLLPVLMQSVALHYQNAFLDLCALSCDKTAHIPIINDVESLKSRYQQIITDISSTENKQAETKRLIEKLLEERRQKLQLYEVDAKSLRDNSSDGDSSRSNGYYVEIKQKIKTLEQLKSHLMRELLKQKRCKKLNDVFRQQLVSKLATEQQEEYENVLEILGQYDETLIAFYRQIGKDLSLIEDELEKMGKLRMRIDLEKTDVKAKEVREQDLVKSKDAIEKLTTNINNLYRQSSEQITQIAKLETQKASVFYSFIENLLETKLEKLYANADQQNQNNDGDQERSEVV
jgi:hypothetical protein